MEAKRQRSKISSQYPVKWLFQLGSVNLCDKWRCHGDERTPFVVVNFVDTVFKASFPGSLSWGWERGYTSHLCHISLIPRPVSRTRLSDCHARIEPHHMQVFSQRARLTKEWTGSLKMSLYILLVTYHVGGMQLYLASCQYEWGPNPVHVRELPTMHQGIIKLCTLMLSVSKLKCKGQAWIKVKSILCMLKANLLSTLEFSLIQK